MDMLVEQLTAIARVTWHLLLDTGPWLVLGLLLAGAIQAFLPTTMVQRWLSGRGFGAAARAAVVGTPLPLCSCSVLPAAIALRQRGASKGATVSFLISTPENGVDSIAISYALLGPFMTITRVVAALLSAVGVGWLAERIGGDEAGDLEAAAAGGCCSSSSDASTETASGGCCAATAPKSEKTAGCCDVSPAQPTGGCCDESAANATAKASGGCCDSENSQPAQASSCCDSGGAKAIGDEQASVGRRLIDGWIYAFTSIWDDIKGWLAFGIVLAAAVAVLVPTEVLQEWGQGPLAMVVMLLIGIPMYICATASTPVAAALLMAGVSPGAVLVFLLAGPATNLGGFFIIRRTLGTKTSLVYLIGMAVTTLLLGLATNVVVGSLAIDVQAQVTDSEMLPLWLGVASLVLLTVFAIPPVRRLILPGKRGEAEPATDEQPPTADSREAQAPPTA